MDFMKEAEKLMAAKTNTSGGNGIRPSEWAYYYGADPDAVEERVSIARWLKGFASRVRSVSE